MGGSTFAGSLHYAVCFLCPVEANIHVLVLKEQAPFVVQTLPFLGSNALDPILSVTGMLLKSQEEAQYVNIDFLLFA